MKLIAIPAPDFDLAKTLDSGQVFHWQKCQDGFVGTIGVRAVYIEQRDHVLLTSESAHKLDRCRRSSLEETATAPTKISKLDRCLRSDFEQNPRATNIQKLDRFYRSSLRELVSGYFALDHPLAKICQSLPRDPAMEAAKDFCRGLRIIRQPKWECLATFICSSMKQVAHIRQITFALRRGFGEQRKIAGFSLWTFPSAERLAECSEKELRGCALGYRAKNLLATARLVAAGGVDLEALASHSDQSLRNNLCALPGVGAKVANCVMLFAYERLRAFPVDVWIERVLRENYFSRRRRLNASRMRAFTEGYFGDYGGYAQQYLFHYARTTKGLERRAPSRPRRSGTTRRSSLHDKRY